MKLTKTEDKDRRAADNSRFAKAGVSCFVDKFVQDGSSVLRMKFSANKPHHLKPQKRWAQVKKQDEK